MSSLESSGSFKWRQHFPYSNPREIQGQALQILQDNWNKYDVFVLGAPTAFGKTAVARCIMESQHSVSVITPTNLLVDQFRDEFPDTPTLSRLDSYYCSIWRRPSAVTRNKLGSFCSKKLDCPGCRAASTDLARAHYGRGSGIYNYYIYLAHKLYRDVLVVDEAHNLIPVIRDRFSMVLWQHDLHYPSNMHSNQQIQQWLSTLPAKKRAGKKLQSLIQAVESARPEYIATRTVQEFGGKGTERGKPELRDCIKLSPVDISQMPGIFWPTQAKKIILMSATIGRKDCESLGLGNRRRILYIDCASPIPPEARPIVTLCPVSVNHNNISNIMPELVRHIEGIAAHHQGEKGVIHATYQLASLIRNHLHVSDRYIFHTREDKKQKYHEFRNSDPSQGKILVASGMYEGIDLPDELGRWQIISKIPWMSLGAKAIQYLAEKDPAWYTWECMKITIQACGRICRTPEDFGVTYILDKSFWRMYNDGRAMVPKWFDEALVRSDNEV